MQGTAVATVSCSAQTTAANIIQKLEQMCGTPVSTNTGRVLRPRVRFMPLRNEAIACPGTNALQSAQI